MEHVGQRANRRNKATHKFLKDNVRAISADIPRDQGRSSEPDLIRKGQPRTDGKDDKTGR